jgi:uncharacterized protein (TIGR03118 family)
MRQFAFGLLALGVAAGARAATGFTQTNLVTNNPVANPATISDSNLVNAWGIGMSSTSPFWVSDNGKGVATLYQVDPATQTPTKVALTVSIPDEGSVTGQVFNSSAAGGAFNGDNFLFVSEDGSVSGWRNAIGTTAERLAFPSTNNVYKGCTFDMAGTNSYLLSANFRSGNIDVFKGAPGTPDLPGKFTDPGLGSGFAPFNIQKLGSKIYVTYAKTISGSRDAMDGPGLGFVSAFDSNGNFLGRVGSQGTLNAPWGMTIAPASFGEFAGDLLVGNFGDGRINAFDLASNSFVGQLNGAGNLPLSINGLWGLTTGNGAMAGSTSAVYFTAGPNNESNGLFGVLTPAVPEPACLAILSCALGLYRRRRHRRKHESIEAV